MIELTNILLKGTRFEMSDHGSQLAAEAAESIGEARATSGRRRLGTAFWLVVVLILLSVYIGAYYLLAAKFPEYGVESYEDSNHVMFAKPDYFPLAPELNEKLRSFFHPVHLIDRTIRKDHWRA